MKIYAYEHAESGIAWESLLPPEIEAQDVCVEVIPSLDNVSSDEYTKKPLAESAKVFSEFMEDPDAWDMFITGPAGSGKTTDLYTLIEACMLNGITYVVCAYTHQACDVLRSKLPKGAVVQTLHSFLTKRPGINDSANHKSKLAINYTSGVPEPVQVMFVDEFGVVGEKDQMDIRALQDPQYEGEASMHVVWIGDLNQLKPVGDVQMLEPSDPYWVKLSHNYRTNGPLLKVLTQLISFIEGAEPEPLIESEAFIRGKDIEAEYRACKEDKLLLAYTNQRVQELNFSIEGKEEPEPGDKMFCSTNKQKYTFLAKLNPREVVRVDQYWDQPLELNSKYKTLEFLISEDLCDFYLVQDEEGEEFVYPVVFGTFNHKRAKDLYSEEAVQSNKIIEKQHRVNNAAKWAKANYTEKLARHRAKAWRYFLTFNDTVMCMDFTHALTVHKSQGCTCDHVFLDTDNIGICADRDYSTYLRLMYVGISRARYTVITN